MKKDKGITLVALVITIIILLILAGITLMALTGDNGLFTRAKEAKEKTQKGAATEKINLVIADVYTKSYAEDQEEPTLQDLADGFCEDEETEYVDIATRKTSALNKIEIGTNEAIYVKLKNYPYEFKINGSLKIATIDGAEFSETTGGTGSTGDAGNAGDNGNTSDNVGLTEEQVRQIIREECKGLTEEQTKAIVQEEVENKIASVQVNGIYETIYEGNASEVDKIYNLKSGKSINDYKYIIVYAKTEEGQLTSVCIDKNYYNIGSNVWHIVSTILETDWRFGIDFYFTSESSFKIMENICVGWAGPARICLIKGVK